MSTPDDDKPSSLVQTGASEPSYTTGLRWYVPHHWFLLDARPPSGFSHHYGTVEINNRSDPTTFNRRTDRR